MVGGRKLDLGELLGFGVEQVRLNFSTAAIALLALAVVNTLLDQATKSGGLFASGMASLAAQYAVVRTALARANLLPAGFKGRFGGFWGLNIITGLLMILGFVFLVIPGIFLAARWFVSGPALLADDLTVRDAMSESWEVTKPSTWHIFGALVLVYTVSFGIALVPAMIMPEDQVPIVLQLASYLLMFGGTIFAWLMSVGTYQVIVRPTQHLAEVFA